MQYTFLHYGGAHMYQEAQQTRHAKKNYRCLQVYKFF